MQQMHKMALSIALDERGFTRTTTLRGELHCDDMAMMKECYSIDTVILSHCSSFDTRSQLDCVTVCFSCM